MIEGVRYPVWIGAGATGKVSARVADRDVLVLSDTNVAPLHMPSLCDDLSSARRIERLVVSAGEQVKTLGGFSQLMDTLVEGAFHRDAVLVALGGGVIGDLGGFAAACYQRGIDWIAVPTTLLAQVDASLGGKTAINHVRGKNLIGAFHDPLAVCVDPARLRTLPAREYRAGLAEVVKYGLGLDSDFFAWLESHAEALGEREPDALAVALETSIRAKLQVVSGDRLEEGRRALLNLGHTLGHALETALGHGTWLHGEAVAVGMLVAAELSASRATLDADVVSRLRDLLRRFGLPVSVPEEADDVSLKRALALDKKVLAGHLRFIGLEGIGNATVWDDVGESELFRATDRIRSQ